MTQKLLFVSALKQELKAVKKGLSSKKKQFQSCYFETVGVGLINSLFNIQSLILELKPDVIISTGVAGALKPELKIGDIIFPEKSFLLENGYFYGNNEYCNFDIVKYPELHCNNKKTVHNFFPQNRIQGNIVSGNSPVFSAQKRNDLYEKFSASIVDMETFSIAYVCYKYKMRLITIKSISDCVDDNLDQKIVTLRQFINKDNFKKACFSLEQFFRNNVDTIPSF